MGIKKELYELANEDAQSIRLWVKTNPERVLLYQEFKKTEQESEHQPFILCIQDPWQLAMMRQHGHQNALSFDATFGTNKSRVCHVAVQSPSSI